MEEAKEVVGILCLGTKIDPLNNGRREKVVDFLMVYGGLIEIKLQYGLGYNLCGKNTMHWFPNLIIINLG